METKVILDLPKTAYIEQALPQSGILQEYQFDPAISWVHPLTKSSGLSALASVENQIEEICKMPAGWDGYGALPISQSTKYNALAALRGILGSAKAPDITPNPNGTLSFEWETHQGVGHLEIGQTRLSFYIQPNRGDPIFLDASSDDLLVSAIKIGLLVSGNLFQSEHISASVTEVNLARYVSPAY